MGYSVDSSAAFAWFMGSVLLPLISVFFGLLMLVAFDLKLELRTIFPHGVLAIYATGLSGQTLLQVWKFWTYRSVAANDGVVAAACVSLLVAIFCPFVYGVSSLGDVAISLASGGFISRLHDAEKFFIVSSLYVAGCATLASFAVSQAISDLCRCGVPDASAETAKGVAA